VKEIVVSTQPWSHGQLEDGSSFFFLRGLQPVTIAGGRISFVDLRFLLDITLF